MISSSSSEKNFRQILCRSLGPSKKRRQSKKEKDSRYYSRSNRKVIKAAPAATARSVRNRTKVQDLVESQESHLTIYETELVEESQPNTEIEILQLKTRDFNRKLQEDKENINLWLEFVDFQDDIFQDQVEKAENGKNISSKALNEKKVKMLKIFIKNDCFFIIEQKSNLLRSIFLGRYKTSKTLHS